RWEDERERPSTLEAAALAAEVLPALSLLPRVAGQPQDRVRAERRDAVSRAAGAQRAVQGGGAGGAGRDAPEVEQVPGGIPQRDAGELRTELFVAGAQEETALVGLLRSQELPDTNAAQSARGAERREGDHLVVPHRADDAELAPAPEARPPDLVPVVRGEEGGLGHRRREVSPSTSQSLEAFLVTDLEPAQRGHHMTSVEGRQTRTPRTLRTT